MKKLLSDQKFVIYNNECGFLCSSGMVNYFSFKNFEEIKFYKIKNNALKKIDKEINYWNNSCRIGHANKKEMLICLKNSNVIHVEISIGELK